MSELRGPWLGFSSFDRNRICFPFVQTRDLITATLHCHRIGAWDAGITPLYRGVHGAYWALAEGRRDLCGVTVHRVDAGIDTGEVLAQVLIDPTPQDNFVTYPWLQVAEGGTTAYKANPLSH